jgi:hypothetical protein
MAQIKTRHRKDTHLAMATLWEVYIDKAMHSSGQN